MKKRISVITAMVLSGTLTATAVVPAFAAAPEDGLLRTAVIADVLNVPVEKFFDFKD